jgi:hypothetical protein
VIVPFSCALATANAPSRSTQRPPRHINFLFIVPPEVMSLRGELLSMPIAHLYDLGILATQTKFWSTTNAHG